MSPFFDPLGHSWESSRDFFLKSFAAQTVQKRVENTAREVQDGDYVKAVFVEDGKGSAQGSGHVHGDVDGPESVIREPTDEETDNDGH